MTRSLLTRQTRNWANKLPEREGNDNNQGNGGVALTPPIFLMAYISTNAKVILVYIEAHLALQHEENSYTQSLEWIRERIERRLKCENGKTRQSTQEACCAP